MNKQNTMMTLSSSSTFLFPLIVAFSLYAFDAVHVVRVDAYDWMCNFYCYNGGHCRHGYGKFGSYTGDSDDAYLEKKEEAPFEEEYHVNGMYCTCPVGYTGLQCEIKLVVCSRDDHSCSNGSSCVMERASNSGEVFYRCECDATESIMEAPYAHKYCQTISTVFCNKNNDGFTHSTSYCMNGGTCKENSNSNTQHVGCNCQEGWDGDHCEEQIESLGSLTTEIIYEIEENLTAGAIVSITIGVCIGIGILYSLGWCCFKNRRARRNKIGQSQRDGYSDTREII